MSLIIRWHGDGIAKVMAATEKLAGPQRVKVLNRAINHTGDKVFTLVRRTLSKQIGAPQRAIEIYGKLHKSRSSWGTLTYTIWCTGGPIPLKHFRAFQVTEGVSAAPWNRRRPYEHAFIVKSRGGHAFWREGRGRLPIKRIAGPNVPKEMVKDATAAAFNTVTNTEMPRRVEHEIKRLTNGVLS
ncbi:MAG: hypothetical protein K8F92_14815 [Hyphomicrobium sp.]|uniref:hypothetical protein n=1 Tax=Hyphomicrobium sp. TaxID=82 RepID=UPI0013263F6C|nr:hypothetical protein [Hyphomicrobium sp.]KAB2942949.1 MAG: hypothetical protein F9K20_05670 [Hyphomicrobium sp.]MBZ0210904.1 hypothetical protein [Hyphomicrobium sp.]